MKMPKLSSVPIVRSSASRTVLVILLAIGGLELGITGKLAQLWQLAFTGSSSSSAAASGVAAGGTPNNPTAAQTAAHTGTETPTDPINNPTAASQLAHRGY